MERRNERTPSGDAGRSVTYYRIGFGVGAPAAIVFDDELCRDLVLSLLVGDPGTRSPEWWGDEIQVDEVPGGSPFRHLQGGGVVTTVVDAKHRQCGRKSHADVDSSLSTGWKKCCGYRMRFTGSARDIKEAVDRIRRSNTEGGES